MKISGSKDIGRTIVTLPESSRNKNADMAGRWIERQGAPSEGVNSRAKERKRGRGRVREGGGGRQAGRQAGDRHTGRVRERKTDKESEIEAG